MASTLTFVWTDEEVGLLLQVTLNYKTTKFQENIDWESCQSKYADICHNYLEEYLANGRTSGLFSLLATLGYPLVDSKRMKGVLCQ